MSSPTAKSQLAFQRPLLSYVDAHQGGPELGTPVQPRKSRGILALIAAFKAWRGKRTDMALLSMMTDRELSDIGLTRSDLGRVFDSKLNMDLLRRGRAADSTPGVATTEQGSLPPAINGRGARPITTETG